MSADNDDINKVVLGLREESEKVESRIDKHLKKMTRLDKNFTYILNLKKNGVRIFENIRKENPDLSNELASISYKVANIEKHGLAEGSRVYENLKEKEAGLNKELNYLLSKKRKELNEELLRVGKEFKDTKNLYLKELEEFKDIKVRIMCAYDPEQKNKILEEKAKEAKEKEAPVENAKKVEVISAEEMIMRRVFGQ